MTDFDTLLRRLRTYQERMRELEEGPQPAGPEYAYLNEETGKLRFRLDKLRPGWENSN